GYARLAAAGLHFELQAPWWHFGEAAELARDFPETLIIVNHAGLPADRSAEGLTAWHAALDALARQPNVVMK
ncbi:amidohydrolase family protein, partial [Acinetobacter baumannii]|uniref:amidohydrolase family protein n=1 Tax=Acinetobacter baumannii TaxID=470 RepID=UPI0013D1ED72